MPDNVLTDDDALTENASPDNNTLPETAVSPQDYWETFKQNWKALLLSALWAFVANYDIPFLPGFGMYVCWFSTFFVLTKLWTEPAIWRKWWAEKPYWGVPAFFTIVIVCKPLYQGMIVMSVFTCAIGALTIAYYQKEVERRLQKFAVWWGATSLVNGLGFWSFVFAIISHIAGNSAQDSVSQATSDAYNVINDPEKKPLLERCRAAVRHRGGLLEFCNQHLRHLFFLSSSFFHRPPSPPNEEQSTGEENIHSNATLLNIEGASDTSEFQPPPLSGVPRQLNSYIPHISTPDEQSVALPEQSQNSSLAPPFSSRDLPIVGPQAPSSNAFLMSGRATYARNQYTQLYDTQMTSNSLVNRDIRSAALENNSTNDNASEDGSVHDNNDRRDDSSEDGNNDNFRGVEHRHQVRQSRQSSFLSSPLSPLRILKCLIV